METERLVWLEDMERRDEWMERRPLERELHEREALERAERLESRGRIDSPQSCWRENKGIKKDSQRADPETN